MEFGAETAATQLTSIAKGFNLGVTGDESANLGFPWPVSGGDVVLKVGQSMTKGFVKLHGKPTVPNEGSPFSGEDGFDTGPEGSWEDLVELSLTVGFAANQDAVMYAPNT
jgi:hypothetical protein